MRRAREQHGCTAYVCCGAHVKPQLKNNLFLFDVLRCVSRIEHVFESDTNHNMYPRPPINDAHPLNSLSADVAVVVGGAMHGVWCSAFATNNQQTPVRLIAGELDFPGKPNRTVSISSAWSVASGRTETKAIRTNG